ncbi:MAG: TolC family protein [Bacteroidaceae bacterium]
MKMNKLLAIIILSAAALNTSAQTQQTQNPQKSWSLRECIDYAITHNISIQQSKITADQSAISVNTAKWARLPNLNGSAGENWTFGRTTSPVNNTYSDINTANTSLSINTSIPLFTGMKLPNQYTLAKLNLKADLADLAKAKEDLSINVASYYLQTLLNKELSIVAQNQVALAKEQLQRINKLYELGKSAPVEVAEAKATLSQDELSAVQADNTYKLSLLDLSQLLELPTPDGFTLVYPQNKLMLTKLTPPDDIYTQAIHSKSSVMAAKYRLEGSAKSIIIAKSAYLPELSLNAGLGSNYYTISGTSSKSFSSQMKNNLNKYIGLSLSVPIFNRFSTRNQVRSMRLQRQNYALQLDQTKKTLYKEIQQAWYNALAAESKYTSSEAAAKASEESFMLMSKKYENGKATAVEYNEAKTNLKKAQSDKIQAKYDYLFRTKILDFYNGQPIE